MTGLRLTVEQRRMARRLKAEGLPLRQIARQVSCSHEAVRAIVQGPGTRLTRPVAWEPAQGRLTVAEREEISLGCTGASRSPRSRPGWAGRPQR